MAQHPRSYFKNLFVPDYVVTAADMDDLSDSVLFYLDDIGFNLLNQVYIMPLNGPYVIDFSNQQLIQLPSLSGFDCHIIDFSHNLLGGVFIPSSFVNCSIINGSYNHFTSITFDSSNFNIQELNFSNNHFSSVNLPTSLSNLRSLDFSNNSLTSFSTHDVFSKIISINLSSNHLILFNTYNSFTSLQTLNLSDNDFTDGYIWIALQPLADAGISVHVDFSGGTNAGHSTWTAPTLAAESTIIANGGSVSSNP